MPGAFDGFIIAKSYDDDYETADIDIKDTFLPPEFRNYTQPAIDAFNKLLTNTAPIPVTGYNIDFGANNENNTLVMGAYSDTNVKLGNGNNIIINSPIMFNSISNISQSDRSGTTLPVKVSNYIFYPSAQGDAASNTISVGNGNNIVYFDSSIKEVKTGNGNNVFLPSFGSFNWAYNNFQTPGHSGSLPSPYITKADASTWFTPVTQQAAAELTSNNNKYNLDNVYAIVTNWGNGIQTKSSDFAQMTYVGAAAGVPNNPNAPGQMYVDDTKTPTIGGETIIGGKGNDVFYGVDPNFYKYNSAVDQGISGDQNREVFLLQTDNTQNQRFSYQNFKTVKFLGGEGGNIFYLGNPTLIAPDGLQFDGQYTYQIATSHTGLATQADQQKLPYGNVNYGTNSININLSANLNTYTNTAQSFDPQTGENPSTVDKVKAGLATGYAVNQYATEIAALGSAFKVFPILNFGFAAAFAITDLVQLFSPPDPEPIIVDTTTLTQPLGSWKKAIAVNDWNPGTIVNINVDPTATTAPATARWNNIKFTINNPDTSSDNLQGTSITWQQGSGQTNPLLRFDGLGSSKYGYYSYDFETGAYKQIDQSNLAFFGTIAVGVKGINPIQNYTAYNGFVFSSTDPTIPSMAPAGSYQFYWNESTNNTIDITAARQSASSISIEFDSRSLGWYWEPKFNSTLPAGTTTATQDELAKSLSLDPNTSKLWVLSGPGEWSYYTFSEFNNITLAFKDALLAKTYYQVNFRGAQISDNQKETNNLVKSFTTLEKIMPDLSALQQNPASPNNLKSLGQITLVTEKTNADGQKGVDVSYIPDTATGAVYTIFIQDGAGPLVSSSIESNNGPAVATINNYKAKTLIASTPVKQTALDLVPLEIKYDTDVDLNGVIGAPAVSIIRTQNASDSSVHSPTEIINTFYQAIFDRTPDADGLKFWVTQIEKGTPKGQILTEFLNSSEFDNAQASNDEFLSHVYINLLDRTADINGSKFWAAALDKGITHAEVIHAFVHSPEFLSLVGINSNQINQTV